MRHFVDEKLPWHRYQIWVWLITDWLSTSQMNVCSFPWFLKATHIAVDLLALSEGRLKGSLFLTVYTFSPLGLKSLLHYPVSLPSIKYYLFFFFLIACQWKKQWLAFQVRRKKRIGWGNFHNTQFLFSFAFKLWILS